jgi:hypothetical protein
VTNEEANKLQAAYVEQALDGLFGKEPVRHVINGECGRALTYAQLAQFAGVAYETGRRAGMAAAQEELRSVQEELRRARWNGMYTDRRA